MSKQLTLQHETLSWVKKELDAVLDRARRALESYIDDQSDAAALTQVRAQLHQVSGTLQMVELYGGATLAKEMEEVADGLINSAMRNREAAFEVLLRAILQLPDYLEHIQAGNRDLPVVLLPLLNDLRTARDAGLLSERALFFPDAPGSGPAASCDETGGDGLSAEATADSGAVARRLRHVYQIGLLGWFRGQQGPGSLEQVKAVSLKLYEVSRHAASRRLWWTTAALVDALRLGALEPDVAVKSLLGQIDREIKRLGDQREDEFARNVPEELTKNILYYVANAENRSELIEEVKQAYGLNDLLPDNHTLIQARDQIAGPNTELLSKVAQVIREDLIVVRDDLEWFVNSADKDARRLDPAIQRLRTVASTLTMLGLAHPAARLIEQTDIMRGIAYGEVNPTEAILTSLASAILDTETVITNFAASRAALTDFAQRSDEQGLSREDAAIEHRRLLAAVTSEALRDLERAKEIINNFVNAPQDSTALADLPSYFERITGAVAMADSDAAPALIASISEYVSSRLLGGGSAPSAGELEFLADAITSVECTIEALGKGVAASPATLEVGRTGVAGLGFPVVAQSGDMPSGGKPEPAGAPDDVFESASEHGHVSAPAWPAVESASAAAVAGHAHDDNSPAGGIERADAGVNDSPLIAQSPAKRSQSVPPATEFPNVPDVPVADTSIENGDRLVSLTDETDEEILQIFIEEAEEELDSIRRLVPQWREASDDRESLITLRRSFHTLKGSGRLVGAEALSEFAWALENLLNRVIDGTVPPADHVHSTLAQAPQALAELIAQIKGEGAPTVGVVPLIAAAHAMSKPGYVPAREVEKPESSATAIEDDPVKAGDKSAGRRDFDRSSDARDDPIRSRRDNSRSMNQRFPGPSATEPDDQEWERPQSDDVNRSFVFPSPGSPGAIEIEEVPLSADLRSGQPRTIAPDKPLSSEGDQSRDQALLDIFIGEAHQHLRVFDTWLEAATSARSAPVVTDELLRALHTLSGSAHAATVPEIARLGKPVEQYIAVRACAKQPVPKGAISLLQQVSEAIGAIVAALKHADRSLPTNDQLRQRVESLLRVEAPARAAGPTSSAMPVSPDVPPKRATTNAATGASKTFSPEAGTSAGGFRNAASGAADARESYTNSSFDHHKEAKSSPADAGSSQPNAQQQDRELIAIFLAEARDLLDASDNAIQRWRSAQDDKGVVIDLQRRLHTLKGSARMAGCAPMGDLSHALESLIVSVVGTRTAPNPSMFDILQRAFDRLHAMLQQAQKSQPISAAPELITTLDDLRQGRGVDAETARDPNAEPSRTDRETKGTRSKTRAPGAGIDDTQGARPRVLEAAPPRVAPRAPRIRDRGNASAESIRVSAELLDNLVNAAGEINIYRARIEQQITGFGFNLKELEQTVARLRAQLRKLEIETEAQILFRHTQDEGELGYDFDPLELDRYSTMQQLSRALGESVSDLVSIKELLAEQVRDSETLLLQQSRISTDLQEGLMHTRMVQFAGMAPRLRRTARQTADELGKKVELRIIGETNELDRSVLDRMAAPLEHMVRNAISHGIEPPGERRAKGKPEVGQVRVEVAREGSEIVIEVQDDGDGVDLEAVRHKAGDLGMIDAKHKLSNHDTLQLIVQPGFSTATDVTQISGRGVGMNVVAAEIKQLGGVLNIDSTRGQGTLFTVRLPITLAINQALLVQCGEDVYAAPLASIEGVVRLSADELRATYAQTTPTYEYAGNMYELRHLGALLGRSAPALGESHVMYPIMLVKAGERRVALQIDGLLGNREVVIKPVGAQISRVNGIAGATILGDGRVVLILDLAGLVRAGVAVRIAYSAGATAPAATREKAVTVLLVDDSITIRKVTSRILERNNFAVLTAKDGVDAVSQLQDNVPDLVLLDIEMPRMDGYELATYIRNTTRLRKIPIIAITSRSGEKHRRRATEIGVDRYLGKPYQETELLRNINDILGRF